ncbi:hypothetical protein B0H11DRAFT_1911816 [Mycena galericulata]|nr:hypothetical protein B0H11DRAFT_1911816 [Mycena galericulata]
MFDCSTIHPHRHMRLRALARRSTIIVGITCLLAITSAYIRSQDFSRFGDGWELGARAFDASGKIGPAQDAREVTFRSRQIGIRFGESLGFEIHGIACFRSAAASTAALDRNLKWK